MNPKDNRVVTQEDIEKRLRELGLSRGDIVEVHSSLSSLGHVDGGAISVIYALMVTVGESGTIIMSAYPLSPAVPLTDEEKARGISWKTKVLSEDSNERTSMGIIPDIFKKLPGVICGQGIHRVAAWGNEAELHSHGYKYLLEKNGWALLIGVGVDRLSSLHIGEEVPIPKDIQKYTDTPEEILKDYPVDTWSVGCGETPEDGWKKVFEKAEGLGLIRHQKIGDAECLLFRARDLVNMLKEWRQTDPYGLYGVKKN